MLSTWAFSDKYTNKARNSKSTGIQHMVLLVQENLYCNKPRISTALRGFAVQSCHTSEGMKSLHGANFGQPCSKQKVHRRVSHCAGSQLQLLSRYIGHPHGCPSIHARNQLHKIVHCSSVTDAAILQYSTADNKAGLNSTSTCNNQAFVCLQAADQLLCSAVLLLLVYYVVQQIPKFHL